MTDKEKKEFENENFFIRTLKEYASKKCAGCIWEGSIRNEIGFFTFICKRKRNNIEEAIKEAEKVGACQNKFTYGDIDIALEIRNSEKGQILWNEFKNNGE